jgi:hypothetical protein
MRLFAMVLLACATTFAAGPAKTREKSAEIYAVISGTVFRDTGAALPGAEVTLAPSDDTALKGKAKKSNAVSDSRGEFAFRVPAGQAGYTLTVRAKGYQEQQKPVATTGQDRLDVFFRLDPASN